MMMEQGMQYAVSGRQGAPSPFPRQQIQPGGTNPYMRLLSDYVLLCPWGQMDLDLLQSAIHNYGKTGEIAVSWESASFAAHWVVPLMVLSAAEPDYIRTFLEGTISAERLLNAAGEEAVRQARTGESLRRLRSTRPMYAGTTVFSYDAMLSFRDIASKNRSVLTGTKLARMADSMSAGYSAAERVALGALWSEAPYLLRALNYDPVFYQELTVRLGEMQKKYGFQPV